MKMYFLAALSLVTALAIVNSAGSSGGMIPITESEQSEIAGGTGWLLECVDSIANCAASGAHEGDACVPGTPGVCTAYCAGGLSNEACTAATFWASDYCTDVQTTNCPGSNLFCNQITRKCAAAVGVPPCGTVTQCIFE